jgi:hypothetical protein
MQNSKTYTKIKSETFNIEKAINRLQWRFKNENVKVGESKIIINELDQKAVDFLIEWINNQKLENLNQNLLFAKLYTYSLINEIEFYKDVEFANKKINEVCKTDIQQLYDEVYRKLNNLEYLKFCKENGIITDHIEKMTLNKEQEQKQKDLIKQNESKLKQILKGLWSKEKTYKSLNNTISETINKFKLWTQLQ